MRTELTTEDGRTWRVRRFAPGGTVVADTGAAIAVSELARRLGRSRRQVYRYLRRGDVKPVGKFLGEWLVEARGLEALGPAPRRPRPLPPGARTLVPEYRPADLHPWRDAVVIVPRIMEQGTEREIAWLLGQYPLPWLRRWIARDGWRLSPRAARFWSWWLGVPSPKPRPLPPLPERA